MRTFRKIFAALIWLFSFSLLLTGLSFQFFYVSMLRSIDRDTSEFEASFSRANKYIQGFQFENNRLPLPAEFDSWAITQPDLVYSKPGRGNNQVSIKMYTSNFPDSALSKLQIKADSGYLLESSHGYWKEYYTSWAGRSSVEKTNYGAYTGSLIGETIIRSIPALAIFGTGIVAGYFIWPRKKTITA
jgi:hypothetical protein